MLRKCMLVLCLLICIGLTSVQAETENYPNGLSVVQAENSDYWRLKNADGDVLIDHLRSEPTFQGKFAVVRQGTGVYMEGLSSEDEEVCLWGLIDDAGKICIPLKYDGMRLINDSGNVCAAIGEKQGLLNAQGDILLDFKYRIYDFVNGYAAVSMQNEQGEYVWGAIDANGNFILPLEYKSVEICSNGMMIVGWAERIGEFEMKTLYGYMNMEGEWIIQPQFTAADAFDGDYARVLIRASIRDPFSETGVALLFGLINTRGEFVLPAQYSDIGYVSEDKTVFAEKDGEEYLFRLTETGAQEVKSIASDIVLEDYMPFTGSKVARLDGEPTLKKRASAGHGHPRLDGATALFPVYSAIVEAVYPDKTRYEENYDGNTLITCTKTNRAYDRLINGETDIIFCAGPSDAQIAVAEAAGVEFELTPFGKEAFVFIVNRDNPLEDISVDQIRQVYSGKITQWQDLGIDGLGDIVAYQRPENSGSQTALQRLMGDEPIMEAPQEVVADFMGDIIETIEYRNLPNAIGYTFRFFCTEMIGSDVKLLSIDGIAPTVENIRNDTYPITNTLYMVTRKGEDNPNVKALMDWVLSDQGRELIEKSGYVAVK